MESEQGPPIVLRGVSKDFGAGPILDGVDLEIPRGKTTAILGPSGTGKSVLLKHVVGLIQPDAGEVRVFGVDMARAPLSAVYGVRRRLGMLFQDGALFDSMTVAENIAFPLLQHAPKTPAAAVRARVAQVLEMVELPGFEGRAIAGLSGGQRKRIGLARAIVHAPEIVLFDEPNSGLDPMTSDAIDQLIQSMKAQLGVTFVVITHDIVGAINVADNLVMLYKGQIIAQGSAAVVTRSPHPIVRRFFGRNLQLPEPDSEGLPKLPTIG